MFFFLTLNDLYRSNICFKNPITCLWWSFLNWLILASRMFWCLGLRYCMNRQRKDPKEIWQVAPLLVFDDKQYAGLSVNCPHFHLSINNGDFSLKLMMQEIGPPGSSKPKGEWMLVNLVSVPGAILGRSIISSRQTLRNSTNTQILSAEDSTQDSLKRRVNSCSGFSWKEVLRTSNSRTINEVTIYNSSTRWTYHWNIEQ